MINEKELSIGNYVGATLAGKADGYEFENKFTELCYKENGFIPIQIEIGEQIDDAKDWNFPIPLTKELLLIIGFEDLGKDPVYGFERFRYSIFTILIDDDGHFILDEYGVLIESLHQLQNACFVLGDFEEELKIEH